MKIIEEVDFRRGIVYVAETVDGVETILSFDLDEAQFFFDMGKEAQRNAIGNDHGNVVVFAVDFQTELRKKVG